MTHRLLITFSQVPYISAFLNKMKCDNISVHIELFTPRVEEVCVSYKAFKPEDAALKDDIAKIAYSCGASSIKELKCRNSKSKPRPTISKTLTVSSTP